MTRDSEQLDLFGSSHTDDSDSEGRIGIEADTGAQAAPRSDRQSDTRPYPQTDRPLTSQSPASLPDVSSTSSPDSLLDGERDSGEEVKVPRPATLPMGSRWREVQCAQQLIGFVLLRSKRRTIGFLITDDGLRVTAPNWVTLAQIDAAVQEKSRWILAKLRDWHSRQAKLALAQTRWQAGGQLPYLGKRIVLHPGSDTHVTHLQGHMDEPEEGDRLLLALPVDADSARVRDAAQAWLQGRARTVFSARLTHFLQRTGLHIKRWRISGAATRWGSCTSDGSIMLNWRLIHFAPSIIDYVIAHELAHLREMNHSSDFWAEVEQILPDYEQARAILKRHDPATLPD